MKKQLLFALFLFIIAPALRAQFAITGMLKDTTNESVTSATVMLLNPSDFTLVNYTSSDAKGSFAFKNVKKTNYILKVSHFTYMPIEIPIEPNEEKEMNVGVILMKPIANFLMEVVIKEARAPIYIKGDTVEYDASTFKVPPGSTVEDLLRKLPGLDVDAEGNIFSMGKDVKTVYVDGKNFFGNDPKTVTQNLDAQAVSKVQVFTEKSEQEKLTGISDGSKEKVMNLELKDEYKKGYFGKASLGGGWGEPNNWLWLAKGSFNWFTEKQQLSFIGYGNNLNQSNMEWNDMSEFRGQSMQSGNDNGDFGFNSRPSGMRFVSYSSYGSDGSGFSNNGGGGVNYNYFHKKIKFNAGYLYTVNHTYSDVLLNRQTFLTDSIFWRMDSTHNNRVKQNHNFSTRFEYEIDSLNSIILRANLGVEPDHNARFSNQLFQTSGFENINLLTVDNKTENDNINFDVLAIYNHKFKKKGRSFSMSGFYKVKDGSNWENINNINKFYDAISPSDQIRFLVENNQNSEDHTVKSSLLYVEPLGKRFALLGFYNFINSISKNLNQSIDPLDGNNPIDSLWLDYGFTSIYNRVGTSVNYAHNGINLTLGGAFQSMILKGALETKANFDENLKPTSYNHFIPYFNASLQLPKNFYVNASYNYIVNEPSISYLFPMPNLQNSLWKTLGNPNLKPEIYHSLNGSLNYWNSASMMSFYLNAYASFYESQIVYNQTTAFVENLGYLTISEPNNVKGGDRYGSNIWMNMPIVKTILTMNLNMGGSIRNSPVFINQIENNTNSKNYNSSIGFTINVKQKLTFTAGANISQTFTQYSIQTDRNQDYLSYGARVTAKWQVFKKTFLEGSYRFSNNRNKKLDFYRDIHNLDVSIRQVIGKKNQWEMRLAALDILNQNQYISQEASMNYIQYRTAPTIARYFFLTVSYNLKGFELANQNSQRRVMRGR